MMLYRPRKYEFRHEIWESFESQMQSLEKADIYTDLNKWDRQVRQAHKDLEDRLKEARK